MLGGEKFILMDFPDLFKPFTVLEEKVVTNEWSYTGRLVHFTSKT